MSTTRDPIPIGPDPALLARPDALSTVGGRIGTAPGPETYPIMDIIRDLPAALLQWTDTGGALAAFNRGAAHQSEAIERARTRTDIDPTAQAIAAILGVAEPGPRDLRTLATVFVGYPALMKGLRQGAVREGGEAALKRLRLMEEGFNLDLPLYHGTSHHFTELEPKGWGDIWFSTDPKDAERYFSGAGEARARTPSPNIHPVYVKTENPFRGTLSEYNEIGGRELKKRGYDSAIIEFPDGRTHVAVFDKKNIMSQFDVFPDEKIVGNAVRLGTPDRYKIVAGPHPAIEDIIQEAKATGQWKVTDELDVGGGLYERGFLTSSGRFVDSNEALGIAKRSRQWSPDLDALIEQSNRLNTMDLEYPLPWHEFNQQRSLEEIFDAIGKDRDELAHLTTGGNELLEAFSKAGANQIDEAISMAGNVVRRTEPGTWLNEAARSLTTRGYNELTSRAVLQGDPESIWRLRKLSGAAGMPDEEIIGHLIGSWPENLADARTSAVLAELLKAKGY